MDMSKLTEPVSQWLAGIGGVSSASAQSQVVVMVVLGILLVMYIVQALIIGGLARSKGYSFFGNFLLGLVFNLFALIYEAGRPVSYERECVMQDRLAMQTAKELYKLQRAREKAQAATASKPH